MNPSLCKKAFFAFLVPFFSLSITLNAQPYFYYERLPVDTNGLTDILRVNLSTGAKELFLSGHRPATSELQWDGSQAWLYFWSGKDNPQEGKITIINTSQSSFRKDLPEANVSYSLGLRYIPQLHRLYI